MPQNYVPIFLFVAVVGVLISAILLVARIFRAKEDQDKNDNRDTPTTSASNVGPDSDVRDRYAVSYYISAILFVVFDVAAIFLFPWAVKFKSLGIFGLVEIAIFFGILIVGYIWLWKKGTIAWV